MATVSEPSSGPLKVVHGSPVQGAAVASEAEKLTGKVDVASEADVALGGYDCVSYYAPGASSPVLGVPEHEVTTYNVVQGDVRYRFASADNAEAFKKSPKKFLASYGGYCACGVAKSLLLHADPLAFSVCCGDQDNQKLCMFCCDKAKQSWEADFEKKRADADATWPKLAKGEPNAEATTCCAECGCCNAAKRCDAAKSCDPKPVA